MKKAMLVLSDNTVYRGLGIGAYGSYFGELVFNTAMTGYIESLTDPSYAGQILLFSYPLIGNCGVSSKWLQSTKIYPKAIIASEVDDSTFHYMARQSLPSFLEKHKIGGIIDVDTRAIIKKIRTDGEIPAVLSVFENCNTNFVTEISTKKPYIINPYGKKTIVLIDYGVKGSIPEKLISLGLKVVVLPASASIQIILSYNPSGIILSNGPGDPVLLQPQINTIRELFSLNIPIFGICLGHELLGLAVGGKTYKLPFGHRGINQPVSYINTKKAYLISQNHSYAIKKNSLPKDMRITFWNLNDGSIEGIEHKSKPWFSVQFHPEGHPGPYDTTFLFDKFFQML